ncbi:hypothetical protein OTB20_28630 [Streptomyces sp. H27-H1]|uniref:hypothetical protein n=1 Tax=Streptomyces sp. H27-H1 TaxID=2996461 RepID=UPI00226E2DCF|nr:hypothetical protein [Streptomyces sp. H27-H1]MCY0930087.1 hypothetical protein [Streptomyces sp. H27-H1]
MRRQIPQHPQCRAEFAAARLARFSAGATAYGPTNSPSRGGSEPFRRRANHRAPDAGTASAASRASVTAAGETRPQLRTAGVRIGVCRVHDPFHAGPPHDFVGRAPMAKPGRRPPRGPRAHLAGLGPEHTDGLTKRRYEDEDGTLTPVDHVERFQTAPAPVTTVRDEVLGRVASLAHHDHSEVVVRNPGAELARGTADLAPQEHRHFLCAESARVGRPLVAHEGRPGRLAVELRMAER